MNDSECVRFLQWALPRLGLRWKGFRKVRRQVCRRVRRRAETLGIDGLSGYREYLEAHPGEWPVLDGLTGITISSFYRDRGVWDFLRGQVLGTLSAGESGELRAWCVGCASGEEPYTLMLAWRLDVALSRPGAGLRVVATDMSRKVLERARVGCYSSGSLKQLPPAWLERAFERGNGGRYCLLPEFREGIEFRREDVRAGFPGGRFDLIFCRNLVFTYFEASLQRRLLARMLSRLRDDGVLVLGKREALPAKDLGLEPWSGSDGLGIFRRARRLPAPA